MRKHYTEAQRAELVALVTRGEASPRRAATRLGVPESTAYYWLKRSRCGRPVAFAVAKGPAQARPAIVSGFARLVPAATASPAITIRVGDAAIGVTHDFDAELLRAVVAALTGRAP